MHRTAIRNAMAWAAVATVMLLCFQKSTAQADAEEIQLVNCAQDCYLRVGESWTPEAKVAKGASGTVPVWTSQTPSVVKVTGAGTMTGVKAGTGYVDVWSSKNPRARKTIKIRVTTTRFIAHAGLNTDAPADTKKAFELAGEAHFWGAEADLHVTKKNKKGKFKIVVCHDSNLKAICGVNKRVKDMTWAQLKKLKVISGAKASLYKQGICTLDAFLAVCKRYGMVPYLDIKTKYSEAQAKKIVNTLHKYGVLEETRCVGRLHTSLSKLRNCSLKKYKTTPKVLLNCLGQDANLANRTPAQQIRLAIDSGFQGISLLYWQASRGRMLWLAAKEMEVNLWTFSAESKSEMKSLLREYPSIDTVMVNGMVE